MPDTNAGNCKTIVKALAELGERNRMKWGTGAPFTAWEKELVFLFGQAVEDLADREVEAVHRSLRALITVVEDAGFDRDLDV